MYIIKNLKTLVKSLFTSVMLLFFSYNYAQNSTYKSTAFTLGFVNGISSPMGDFQKFSESGFMSDFVVNKAFCNKISIGLNTNFTALPIENKFGISNEKWSSFSISIGPQYHIDINKVFVEFYGQLGLSFINIPEVTDFYPQTNLIATDIKESNSSGLNTRFGINFGTEICKGFLLFVSTEYNTNINGEINYQTRDFSRAIDESGEIDPDLASDIPFENRDFSFSTININFGIRLDLGSKNQKAQDHNASRSNTTSSVKSNPDNDLDKQNSTISYSKMLVKMDINKDKKISKSEAKGDLKDNFEKRDVNKDGYITEDEMKTRN